jgi:agmatine deiminase
MKKFTLYSMLLMAILLPFKSFCQDLPHHMTQEEQLMWPQWYQNALLDTRVVSPPPSPVRSPGEWEELQAICITWTSYTSVLREIVRHAQMECTVIIHCTDSNTVKSFLTSGSVPLTSNLMFIEVDYNSVWIRDYGAQSVYRNDVEDLYLIDWKYNRPRPDDDAMPMVTAAELGIPIYEMNASPYLLVATGATSCGTALALSCLQSSFLMKTHPSPKPRSTH